MKITSNNNTKKRSTTILFILKSWIFCHSNKINSFFWSFNVSSWHSRQNTVEITSRVFFISLFAFFLSQGCVDTNLANFFTDFFSLIMNSPNSSRQKNKSQHESTAIYSTYFSKSLLTLHTILKREQFLQRRINNLKKSMFSRKSNARYLKLRFKSLQKDITMKQWVKKMRN